MELLAGFSGNPVSSEVKIKTNLTETINHLFVEENMIWTGGQGSQNQSARVVSMKILYFFLLGNPQKGGPNFGKPETLNNTSFHVVFYFILHYWGNTPLNPT